MAFFTDSIICPVKSFCLYMKKLNPNLDALWQHLKTCKFNKTDKVWYDNIPIGHDPLNDTMKNLSKNSGLLRIYTNHCIWASVVTSLDEKGFEARHIMATTGQRSESSIKSYVSKCPDCKRREMCDALASNLIDKPKATRTVSKHTECSAIITIPEQIQEDQLAIE